MLNRILQDRVATLLIVTLAVILTIGAIAPGFLSVQTASSIWSSAMVLLCVAIGLLPVLLMRQIDVSGGSVLGLSAVVIGLSLQAGFALPLAIALALLSGIGAGLLNGLLVTGLGVPAIVATLGTLGLFRGVMLIATGGKWIENLPSDLKSLAASGTLGLSPLGFAVIALIVLGWFALQSRRGQWLKAIGDNREAARHLGLPVKRLELGGFVFAGFCSALAGIIFAAQIGFIPNQAGNGIELRAIAALVLGGVSLLGGVGRISGAVIGVLFLTSIDTALIFLKIPAFWNDLVGGALLLGVLLIDGRLRLLIERRDRAARHRHTQSAKTEGTA
ncbi:ABC transporter permease subunit [Paracoccus aminophilus]|uniref:Autoinducer 2 import system permease protein LsrC n=1 Tax=Paracoccus aminophilus JCM 7686 TaxID=1367847 RepID=S5XZL4_PARAH|nr:ribose/xylose/arabinose/galactoside ABC-type transport systems, permease component [Paracoccus aminophilus]AGT10732.1 ribose/xylose/arabinose/galactoside ABC-type transport systems, permease component [Paracoccus aminophilus JCM 7686]